MALLHSTAVLHFICSTRLLAETTPSVGFQNTIFVWREAQKTLVLNTTNMRYYRICLDVCLGCRVWSERRTHVHGHAPRSFPCHPVQGGNLRDCKDSGKGNWGLEEDDSRGEEGPLPPQLLSGMLNFTIFIFCCYSSIEMQNRPVSKVSAMQ